MSDALIISLVSMLCLSVAYFFYMRKEIKGKNLGIKSTNGSGEGLYGKKNVKEDGSYVATKWFMILLIPIIPLGTYRIWKGKISHNFVGGMPIGIQRSTELRMERLKMDWQQVLIVYTIMLTIFVLIALIIYFISISLK